MTKLTKGEVNTLNRLLEKDGIRGKKLLKWVLWANQYEPKYKLGDRVLVTDRRHIVGGKRVVDFNGVVTDVAFRRDLVDGIGYVQYEVTVNVILADSGVHKDIKVYALENSGNLKKTNNVKPIVIDKYTESLEVSI